MCRLARCPPALTPCGGCAPCSTTPPSTCSASAFCACSDLETLSANINVDTPSTVDFPFTELSPEQLRQVEDLANQVIYENRVVKSYFVAPEDIAQVPLRRPPKVNENIRIIEIDGYDHSACGGTHVPQTGMIGVVKILRTERQNEKTRVHFIAGWQALEAFQAYHAILGSLAVQLNVGIHGAAPGSAAPG